MSPRARAAYAAPVARVPRTLFEHAHQDGNAAFPPQGGAANVLETFTLLPDNWNGTDAVVVWLLGGATGAFTIDVTIDVGTCNQVYTTHTQTVAGITANTVVNEYECIDLTTTFATVIGNFNARDMIWIKVTPSTDSSIYEIGTEIQET